MEKMEWNEVLMALPTSYFLLKNDLKNFLNPNSTSPRFVMLRFVRFLGVLLSLFNLAKAITILSTLPHDHWLARIRVCIELFRPRGSNVEFDNANRQVQNIPLENFLPVLKSVDPGDNPFTFPQREPRNANDRNSTSRTAPGEYTGT
jgi:hypothetical protein